MKNNFNFLIFTIMLLFFNNNKLYSNLNINLTSCIDAIQINQANLPNNQSLVCGTTNDINNNTVLGSQNYLGGLESVYKFTPTSSGNFNIAYAGQTYSGIFVFQGCPTSGGSSVGNIKNTSNSKNLTVNLLSGVEYYIVFDTYPLPASPCSGTFTITAPPSPCEIPSAQPTSLTFSSISNSSISGSFTAANAAPSGYLVVRSTSSTLNASPLNGTSYSSGASLGGGIVVGTPGSSTSISATGLTAGTQYYFFVYTYNNTTCSGGPVYNTTSPLSASYWTCPSAPSTPTFSSINSSGMTVNWGSVIGATSYSLEVSTNSGFTAPISGSPFTVAGTSQTLTGLTSGNTYYSRVTAVGPNCNSAVSTAANTLLACETPTSLSNGITFNSAGETTIGASFSTATIAPTSYLVIRTSTNSMPTPTNGNTYTVGSNALGYIEYVSNSAGSWNSTLLTPGTTYYYWIFSYNSGSCSGPVYSSLATNASATTSSCASFNSTILINGGNAVSGVSYPTISDAIFALNTCGGISQPTILELTSGYVNELTNNTLTLPAISGMSNTNTITIRPSSGVSNLEISSSVSGPTIFIDGGDYWIIDGRPGGTGSLSGSNLAITNTGSSTSSMSIQIMNDALGNIIRYSNLKLSNGSGDYGVIAIRGGTTNITGNDNNSIEYNNIDGNGVATNGVFCFGGTNKNDNCIIQNNNIFDFFRASVATNGVQVGSNNDAFTISNNSIYQTVARTYTTGATHSGILINNTSGNNFIVNGNQIGGGFSVNGGPTPANKYTIAGTIANRYKAISIAVGTTTVTSVQSNIITGFDFTTNSNSTSVGGPWCGIYVSAGKVNIGNNSGNTIGASIGNGSISLNLQTNSGGVSSAIYIEAVASDFNISNNSIGSITTTGSTTSIAHGFTGIATLATGAVTISNNVIGSTSTSNSISASNAATTTTSFQYLNGILNTGNSTVLNISNNTIANLNNAYVPSAFQSTINSIICGISSSAGTATITGNTVRNFTANANATNTGLKASVVGISVTSNAGATVSQNVIHSLNSSNMAGTTISVTGIAYSGATTGTNVIERNRIYNLNNTSPTSGRVHGIFIVTGNANVNNNMIRLGYDVSGSSITTPISIYGIFESGGTNNYYHNSMYVGGSNVTSNTTIPSTAAFYCSSATGTRSILNNIFVNARSNSAATGGPKNYAIYLPSTVTGLTSNYNIFQATGIGSVFGAISGGDRADFTAWKASSSVPDANSINADPLFIDPTNATIPDLHINQNLNSPADRSGTIVAAVTTDFDGQTRSAFSAVDIGADAFIKTIIWSNQSWSNTTGPTQYDNAEIQNNLVLNQNLSANNLSIISSFVVTVNPNIVLSIKENLINNGQIIFKSDATGSGMFDQFTGTITGNGTVQVERYIPAKRAFRFVSSPVTTTTTIRQNWQENGGTTVGLGTHITGTGGATNGFDATGTNNASMFTFDNGSWIAVANTNVNVLTAGTAYRLMVRGDRTTDLTTNTSTATATTLRATGTLKTGNFVPTINQTADGFSLVGNPYQAPIDIKAILTASSNMSSAVVYYWDPTLNARGGYVTRNLTTDVNDVTSSFNQYVQPGQAVFVKRDNTANAASVTITESHKSVANGAAGVFRMTTSNDYGLLRVNLQANTNNQWQTIEGTLAMFNDTFSWNVTPEDATKMSNLDEEVSFVQNNTSLAISCVSAPSVNSELPIQLNNLRHSNYQWQFELANYQGERPYLFDTQNNTYTEITNGTTVPFTATTTAANRFKIVFQPSALSTDDFANGLVVYPNPAKAGASFYVQGITAAEVTVYNVLGQNIPVEVKSQGNALQVMPTQTLSQGIYLIIVTTEGKTQQVKWIVE